MWALIFTTVFFGRSHMLLNVLPSTTGASRELSLVPDSTDEFYSVKGGWRREGRMEDSFPYEPPRSTCTTHEITHNLRHRVATHMAIVFIIVMIHWGCHGPLCGEEARPHISALHISATLAKFGDPCSIMKERFYVKCRHASFSIFLFIQLV